MIAVGVVLLLVIAQTTGHLGLRSRGLMVIVVLGVVVALGLMVRGWPSLASPGRRRLAARAGVLVTAQLMAVLVVAAGVNDSFDFYSSWSDLFGVTSAASVAPVAASMGSAGTDSLTSPHRVAPDPRPASIQRVVIPGARTGLVSHAEVLLPPQYFEPGAATHRFPVALVLAGYPGHIGTLTGSVGLPSAVDSLLRVGAMEPTVFVLSSPTLVPPRDTECTNVPGGPQVASFFASDLTAWVGAHYRVEGPGRWGILGFSTGGFCAAKLAMTYPGTFRAAVSVSGTLTASTDVTTGDLFGGSMSVRQMNDPLWRETHLPQPRTEILLTATRQETHILGGVQRFALQARAPLIVDTFLIPTGGHNPGVWHSELPVCLRWLSARLST